MRNRCKFAAIAIAGLLVIFLARPVVSQLLAPKDPTKEKRLRWASAIAGEDGKYDYTLGLVSYAVHDRESLVKAIGKYRMSLRKNPTDGRVWLALAKAYNDLDMTGYAEYAFKKAAYTGRGDRGIQWEAGVFLLLEGKAPDAVLAFKQYMRLVPSDQGVVYSLFYTVGFEPTFILDSLVQKEYRSYREYLGFLMANGCVPESVETWKRMDAWSRSRADYIAYTNFLIDKGNTERAHELWGEYTKNFGLLDSSHSPTNILWNGGFELPVQDGGFDWRIGKADGVRVFIDSDMKKIGQAALSAQFSGKANPEVYLAKQIVLVEPDTKYSLKGRILTDNLTTTNGIVFEARSYLCDDFTQKTEPVTGSTLWKDVGTEFTTPARCKLITVGVKREKSTKFDNRISGDAWIDLVSLIPSKKESTKTR